jgi:hypothetical protein
MKFLASLLVGKPLNILAVAVAFVVAYLAARGTAQAAGRNPTPLLIAAGAWAAYATWEWLVKVRTPEADIRVDLLVLWPVLLALSLWAIYRALR